MKVDGRCHCGSISFEAEVDPANVSICNCTDCQVLSGSAFRVVVPVTSGKLNLLTGSPKFYEKVAESGNRRMQAFCADCGTPLYSLPYDTLPGYLRVGALHQRDFLIPRAQYWCRSGQDWRFHLDEISKYQRDE